MNFSINGHTEVLKTAFLQTTLSRPDGAPAHHKTLDNGTRVEFLDTGILKVTCSGNASYRVVISAGVHGNETAPIEIVDTLVNEIMLGDLVVNNDVLFIIGNPPAVNAEARFIEENLNRLFAGKHLRSNTKEAVRAAKLEQAVGNFFEAGEQPRLHYDLHTAIRESQIEKFAVYPYLHSRDWSRSQLGFLEQCGIEATLLSSQPSGTFSYFSSHKYHADAFTIELGKVRKLGANDMRNFTAMTQGMRRLITGNELFQQRPSNITLFSVVEEVVKLTEAFKLNIKDKAKNFTEFKAGVVLATDEGYEYRTKQDGERFVFPISNVPCGQRAMLVIAPTELSLKEP